MTIKSDSHNHADPAIQSILTRFQVGSIAMVILVHISTLCHFVDFSLCPSHAQQAGCLGDGTNPPQGWGLPLYPNGPYSPQTHMPLRVPTQLNYNNSHQASD